jgi:hypothetical protein
MTTIYALWTHPRSISTAFERVMIERGDLKILHEPFSYYYYVKQEEATIEQQYVDPEHPTDYGEIKAHIRANATEKPVFFKDMCSHCFEPLAEDGAFLGELSNTFLIRDPAKAIASYYAMNPKVTMEEIGLQQISAIFEKVANLGVDTPIVVDADDLEDDPDGIIRAYCQRLGLRFIPEAMSWAPDHQEEWEIWKDWHKDAAQSTGIQKSMESFEVTVDNNDHLKRFYDELWPFYESMYRHRIAPVADASAKGH